MRAAPGSRGGLPEAHELAPPSLLVSVRGSTEAKAALLGGASILDVKEPSRGPLGRACERAQREVVREAALASGPGGKPQVTAAMGELRGFGEARGWKPLPGISLYKFGLAGCGGLRSWRASLDHWRELLRGAGGEESLVAAAYADHSQAGAPSCEEVLEYALERKLSFFLLDTFDKRSGGLRRSLSVRRIRGLIEMAHRGGVKVALAGSLRAEDFEIMAGLGPDVLAVRGAACAGGNRRGPVDAGRVADLARRLLGP